jgi:hypothetical protein
MSFAAGLMAAVALMAPLDARQAPAAGACRITGHATSGTTPLPGVAITIKSGETVKGATSSDIDGGFAFSLTQGQYTIAAELTGFGRIEQPVSIGDGKCAQTIDLALSLAPRNAPINPPAAAPTTPTATAAPATPQTPAATTAAGTTAPAATATAAANGRGAGAAQANGRGRGGQPTLNGFQTLQVQTTESAAAADTTLSATETEQAARALLPPGFSTESAGDAIAISGNSGTVDRGMLQDRFGAIGRGEFDPSNPDGGFGGAGFGAPGGGDQGPGGRGGPGGFQGGRGGPGGGGGFQGGRGGPGGPGGGGFFLGGRGAQQQRYQGTVNYTFGSSVLDAAPFQLRNNQTTPPYTHNTYGGTIGGPVKLGKLYDGTRKTNFVLTYNGNHGNNVFDQYATVPTLAERGGDFSALGYSLINPATGLPFPNNQVPVSAAS